MTRTPIALLLSMALALPQIAAPALADDRSYAHRHGANGPLHLPATPSAQGQSQLNAQQQSGLGPALAALLGLAAVAVIAKEVRDDRDDDDDRDDEEDTARLRPHPSDRYSRNSYEVRRAERVAQKVLPNRCYREGTARYGAYQGYGAQCLQRYTRDANLLPRTCLRSVYTDRGQWPAYDRRCLREAGWTPARKRRH